MIFIDNQTIFFMKYKKNASGNFSVQKYLHMNHLIVHYDFISAVSLQNMDSLRIVQYLYCSPYLQ